MKKLVVLGTLSTLVACTTNQTYEGKQVREYWENYGSDPLNTTQLNDTEALAVIYRPTELQGPAVNIYINGRYQASVLNEGYTPIAVCAEKSLLTASFTANQGFGNRTQGVTYALPAQQKTFIRLTTNELGEPIFERVSEEQAQAEMPLKDKVTQTLSRVNSRCDQPIVIHNAIMNAQAVWDIDKFSFNDILPNAKKELNNLVQFIQQNNTRITHIEVSGYTDPQANDAYNLNLSQRRADAVKQGLINAGVTQPIQAVGYGKQNLVVANCAVKYKHNPKQQAICNAPNRRVEITVFGEVK